MAVNPASKTGILIIILIFLIPAVLCVAEYFLAKNKHEAGMYILPIAALCSAFLVPWYGIVLALVLLAVGLLTKHLQKKKRSELEKMTIEDLDGGNGKKG